MGYRSRGSGEKMQKTPHEKKTRKPKKKTEKPAAEVPATPSLQELADKTTASLNKLGIQAFALSPFSQYYDDWLINLRQTVAEFEGAPAASGDEEFVATRNAAFEKVERTFAELRQKESELASLAKELADNNHRIVELDAKYAAQTRELSEKRNHEIEQLTKNVHYLEEQLEKTQQKKTSFLFGFTKGAKAKQEVEETQKLNSAKTELELVIQNFKVEQDKLHDEYTKAKEEAIKKTQQLEKETSEREDDNSQPARLAATHAIAEAVKALVEKKSQSPPPPPEPEQPSPPAPPEPSQ